MFHTKHIKVFYTEEKVKQEKRQQIIEDLVEAGMPRNKANAASYRPGNSLGRKMKENGKDGQTIKVIEHIILKNFWEVYVIEVDINCGEMFALTVGDFTELGYTNFEEIAPYILTQTKDLSEVMAAPNWEWV